MINESFAYPKNLCKVDWKYPNGTWTTKFYNKESHLLVFYDKEIKENEIQVTSDGNPIAVSETFNLGYGFDCKKAYYFKYATNEVVVQIKNVDIKSVFLFTLNNTSN